MLVRDKYQRWVEMRKAQAITDDSTCPSCGAKTVEQHDESWPVDEDGQRVLINTRVCHCSVCDVSWYSSKHDGYVKEALARIHAARAPMNATQHVIKSHVHKMLRHPELHAHDLVALETQITLSIYYWDIAGQGDAPDQFYTWMNWNSRYQRFIDEVVPPGKRTNTPLATQIDREEFLTAMLLYVKRETGDKL